MSDPGPCPWCGPQQPALAPEVLIVQAFWAWACPVCDATRPGGYNAAEVKAAIPEAARKWAEEV